MATPCLYPYRYGFNGQEKDVEVGSDIYTAEYWEYDSRLGRRWNIDPVVHYWESPYSCFSNAPIWISDVNGDEGDNVIVGGTDEAKTSFLNVLNKSLGGFYTASIAKDNQLQLTKTDKAGEMTISQKEVLETFNAAIQNVMPICIEVTSHTPLLYDSYDIAEIDMGDVENTTDGPYQSKPQYLRIL